jgi:hypothetical protein
MEGNVKRILPFGAGVLVAAGFGFLPMIGCLASAEPAASEEEGQDADDADDADVPLTPEAARSPLDLSRCGRNGLTCCAHACCFDGSACVRRSSRPYLRTCMKHPHPRSVIVRTSCERE